MYRIAAIGFAFLFGVGLLADCHAEIETDSSQVRTPVGSLPIDAGSLLTTEGGSWVALPAGPTHVELTVTGMLVHGKVRQSFHNLTGRTLDAVYVFPLPERAAVHAMELRIGDRVLRSVVQERDAARRTYEVARASGKKAALVEQQRPNLFSIEASNLHAGERVEVELDYVEELGFVDGAFRLRFPLKFTPRFEPPGSQTREITHDGAPPALSAGMTTPIATIAVHLRLGMEAEFIRSDSHPLTVARDGDEYRIVPQAGPIPADRDFHLRWKPKPTDSARAAAFVENHNGERYAMVMIVPPSSETPAGLGLATETMFVVDVSGSMEGPSIVQAREALIEALAHLRSDDRFNLIAFNDSHWSFRDAPVYADSTAVQNAISWVRNLRAGGGTMIEPALRNGLQILDDSPTSHQPRLIFLTDGAVGNEQQVLASVVGALGETRLHTLAVGPAPNSYLIRKMAELGRGHSEFIADPTTLKERLDRFMERIDRPVLTDLRADWKGADSLEIFPSPLPDLYSGEPIFLSARLRGPETDRLDAVVEVSGYSREGSILLTAPLRDDTLRQSGIALHWARAKVENLMDGLTEGDDPKSVREAVLELALDFGLVTRYSSRVAVEDVTTELDESVLTKHGAILPQGGTWNPLKRLFLLGLALIGVALVSLRRFLAC